MANLVDFYTGEYVEYDDYRCHVTKDLLQRKTKTTPDFLKLKLQPYLPIFVYDGFKLGGKGYQVLEGCPYLGEATTTIPTFQMFEFEEQAVVFRKTPSDVESCKIIGDVFVIPPRKILELDYFMGNGSIFHRETTHVFLHEQQYKKHTPSIKAYFYIGDSDWFKNANLKRSKKINEDKRYFYEFNQYA